MVNDLISFLNDSPSVFHAADSLKRMLDAHGYRALNEIDAWALEPDGKYYVTRNLSSVIAFHVSREGFGPMRLTAAHTDSPVFKLKHTAEVEGKEGYITLNTERYGGMIFSTWLDRPLCVAGRALVRAGDGVETRLVDFKRDMLVIPSVAIHMQRDINEGYKYNAQTDLMPLFAIDGDKQGFQKLLAQAAGADMGDVLSADLFLYSRVRGIVWGENDEFVSAGRLDDMECTYTAMRALVESEPAAGLNVCCAFDNEEVGSLTKQGADSTFLTDTLSRAARALGADADMFARACASSVMLSMDNAHAIHPNHPELSDAVNRPKLNGGIVIKESANQKYASDGVSKALLIDVLNRANVKYQHFANRSDMIGGGTLGNVSSRHLSLPTADIGLAQLAMHSSWETAGAQDVAHMVNGVRAFYQSTFSQYQDGAFICRCGVLVPPAPRIST